MARKPTRTLVFSAFPSAEALGFEAGVSAAVKAFFEGRANAGQQAIVRDLVVKQLAGVGFQPHVVGRPDETSFNCGRQHVGLTLINIAAAPTPPLAAGPDGIPRGRPPED